jgi:hypothetical protein
MPSATMPDRLEEAVALVDSQLNDLPSSELMKVAAVFDLLLDVRNALSQREEKS